MTENVVDTPEPGPLDDFRSAAERSLDGAYRLGEELSRAGEAYTFRASRVVDGTPVVLRITRAREGAGSGPLDRDAAMAALLARPADLIPAPPRRLGDVYVAEVPVVAVDTLEALMSREPHLPFDRIVEIVGQIAEELDHAHGRGVIHASLEPSKVIIDRDGRCRVMGFSMLTGSPPPNLPSVLGVPAYMPPEQWHDAPRLDGRLDQYALGVVTYELLIGRRRTEANDAGVKELLPIVVPPNQPLRADVPLSANRAIRKAISRDPNARYATATEFARALRDDSVVHGMPTYADSVKIRHNSLLWVFVLGISIAVVVLMMPASPRYAAQRAIRRAVNFALGGGSAEMDPFARPSSASGGTSAAAATSTAPESGARPGSKSNETTRRDTTLDRVPDREIDPYRSGSSRTGGGGAATASSSEPPVDGPRRAGGGATSTAAPAAAPSTNAEVAGYASISVDGGATALVIVNGRPRGTAPLVANLPPGTHSVRVVGFGGITPSTQSVTIRAGDTARVIFRRSP